MRQQVHTIGEAADIAGPDGVVFNATGLGAPIVCLTLRIQLIEQWTEGARSLIGVEDKLVYPIRGQTILAEAPDVKECIALPIGKGSQCQVATTC